MSNTKQYIIEDWKNGMTPLELAKKYDVSRSYIYQVINTVKDIYDYPSALNNEDTIKALRYENDALKENVMRLEKIIDRLLEK